MQDLTTWINENTQPGPADNWLACDTARRVAEAYCAAVGIPIDDSQSRSITESMRHLGFVPDPGPEPRSNRVLVGQAKFHGIRL